MKIQSQRFLGSLLLVFSITFYTGVISAQAKDLVFVGVEPCRIVDTREMSTPAPITAGTSMDFDAYGSDLSYQGGEVTGCEHPKATSGTAPVAIAANVTAVGILASGNGNIVAFPTGGSIPAASLVNYTTAANIANSTIIKLCTGESCEADFSIQSNYSDVHTVVDVQGYFYEQQELKNIVTVSAENGDFTNPKDALASITDAGPDNRYLVKIGPGTFTITDSALIMKPYVDIQGSGKNVTLLEGPVATGAGWSTSNAVVWGASNATLSDLRVENIGGGGNAAAIYNDNASPTLERLSLIVSSGGIENAIHNNYNSSPTIIDSELEVSNDQTAMYCYNSSNPLVIGSYLSGGFGVWTKTNSHVTIENSYIKGSSTYATVRTDGYLQDATATIFSSTLDGGAVDTLNGATLPQCAAVVDENFTFYPGPTCP